MSRWLAKVFDEQSAKAVADDNVGEQMVPTLVIEHGGLCFVTCFDYLSEVIENVHIITYPEPHRFHLGIINMRGSIVPVFCLVSMLAGNPEDGCRSGDRPSTRGLKDERMVVFCPPCGAFAISADSVYKRLVSAETMRKSQEIELDGKVYRVLNQDFFLHLDELVA